MSNYIEDNYIEGLAEEVAIINDPQSYMPHEHICKTERGVTDEEMPVLAGEDNIFSELNIKQDDGKAYSKAEKFIAAFSRVFANKKEPDRAYSKFIQNKDELPDVELDWVFQNYRAAFLFSASEGDYYCITKFDDKRGKYDSTIAPLKEEDYRSVAEEVVRNV